MSAVLTKHKTHIKQQNEWAINDQLLVDQFFTGVTYSLFIFEKYPHYFYKKNPGSLITYIFLKNQSPKSFRHLKFNLQITIRDEWKHSRLWLNETNLVDIALFILHKLLHVMVGSCVRVNGHAVKEEYCGFKW